MLKFNLLCIMEEQVNMVNVTVIWRGNKYMVEMDSNANLNELGDELQKLTDVKADTMRLIVPQLSGKGSRMLHPFSDEHSCLSLQEASIFMGKTVRMMGAPEYEVDRVNQYSKEDQRIIGFSEEERRLRQRMLDGPSRVLIKLPQGPYIFCDFRTLQLPGVELHPPASEALRRMHMLASDPGIVAVMNKHRWRVGIMTEMAPVGYVGVSPKCILGFNKNHGEEISLRLRTDDLKGFRKYESIKKTLLHELAHMVFSEHDSNFYALDKQLNEEAASLDWTKYRAHTLSGIRHSDNSEEDYYVENGRNSQKVGGNMSTLLQNARASAVAAAYHRLINTSSNVEASKTHDEPDPDEPMLVMHDGDENLDIQSQIKAQGEHTYEPDPDDLSDNQNKFEPDPDDLLHGETLQLKHHSDSTQNGSQTTLEKSAVMSSNEEPDPDDSSASSNSGNVVEPLAMPILDTKVQRSDIIDEPDPDDREAQPRIPGCANGRSHDPHHNITIETLEDQAHFNQGHMEPDPDDAKANEIAKGEPHSDDRLLLPLGISDMKIDEPNLDDQELQRIQESVTGICSRLQKAVEMLRAEVNPTDATIILQTLFKIIRNVIEHPDEMKFRRLRKANPIIQRNIANYKAAMEILLLIGFSEDVILDETYLVLKRNDPGLLWLAKSSLETCIAY
ncbi:uncharacterized protein LOC120164388 isoform X2 [Hibiscus syriacus]|uniref:uncharacterized protein LOC120164388 isoform X2 n=1 Tax=Hibiscus syriacus TaxID=106335 RepID=UPI001921CE79|nr:uncharacterized protein LOC120164388 isoform X2 [Hibiscus syriacus]